MALELVIVIALILLNGFFALAEMALVSARRGRLKALARRDKGAKAALALMEQPSRFLSTVQVGITLVGVMASAVGGATLAERIEAGLAASPTFGPYASAIGVGVVVVGVTILTLILGELVPKRLALGNPERIAARVSGLMALLARIFSPVVTALQVSSSGVIRLFGVKAESAAAVTEEEIRHMVREGAETGAILTVEREMVDRIFRLGDKLVDDVMTPRPQMVTLDAEEPLSENLRRMRDAGYSRYPVMRGEECIGILRAKDVAVEIEKGASSTGSRSCAHRSSCRRRRPLWECSTCSRRPASTWPSSWTNTAMSSASRRRPTSSKPSSAKSRPRARLTKPRSSAATTAPGSWTRSSPPTS